MLWTAKLDTNGLSPMPGRRPYASVASRVLLQISLALLLLAAPLAGQLTNPAAISLPPPFDPIELPPTTCVVTVMNRMSPINPDGSFSIANIPFLPGAFRVRAICDSGGQTVEARSALMRSIANETLSVDRLMLDEEQTIPVSIQLESPKTVLTSAGEVVALTVIGDVGGVARDLSRSEATTYLSSNAAIATVSDEGLVTAVASGRVLITAIHEGVIATLRLDAQLSDDSDGDGLPDDYESLNATNPGGLNLALLPGVQVIASSFAAGFAPERAIDASVQTSWLTSAGDAVNQGSTPFLEVILPTPASVAQIRVLGNRQPASGRDFFAATFAVFDAADQVLLSSGELQLPAPTRDLAVPVDLAGVRRVRFTATADQSTAPGLAEIQLLSAPGGPAFDATDPADAAADFDQDGLSNRAEFDLGSDPFQGDSDRDGLSDPQEVALGSSPTLPDSDLDGLLDGDETDPAADVDGDGLINVLDPDSDDDGLPDGIEFALVGHSTGAAANADSDGDGLVNLDEVEQRTDPGDRDTDNDSLDDLQEVLGITDPLDPDSDDDGFPDGFEVGLGSNPIDDNSLPDLSSSSGEAVGNAFSILNEVDPSASGAAGVTVNEAASSLLSVLNIIEPRQETPSEIGSAVLSLLNRVDPGTQMPVEIASPLFSLLQRFAPAPPTPIDATSPLLSLLSLTVPRDPDVAIGEAVSSIFSILGVTDPAAVDGEGLDHAYETVPGLPPRVRADDADGDGLTSFEESLLGTDPDDPDSDGDGLSDGLEAGSDCDPLTPESETSRKLCDMKGEKP